MSLADRARTRGTPGWGRIARGGSRRDRVRSEVEQLIIYGVLAPGEHLREEGLAERLRVVAAAPGRL